MSSRSKTARLTALGARASCMGRIRSNARTNEPSAKHQWSGTYQAFSFAMLYDCTKLCTESSYLYNGSSRDRQDI